MPGLVGQTQPERVSLRLGDEKARLYSRVDDDFGVSLRQNCYLRQFGDQLISVLRTSWIAR